jgi:D-alanyl-D-alanine-carboxypeptidase/D-alanyl-D-alanine-endopeptidase
VPAFRRSLFLAGALLGSAFAAAQTTLPLSSADAAAQAIFEQTHATGMVFVAVRRHEVHLQGFGTVAPGRAEAPSATSLLRLCSLTKIFTTDLLVKLGFEGKVKLTDPLQLFAPQGVRVPTQLYRGANQRPMTLGDLATHTAGLPREQSGAPTGTVAFTFPTEHQRWHWLPRQRLRSVPGTAALYSNVGFDLLGDALAAAAREPYPQLLAERTTRPLAMPDTTYTPTAEQCARLMAGFERPQDAYYFTCADTRASAGSGGLYSTPDDMAKWLEYLLNSQNFAAQAVYLQPASLVSVQGLSHAGDPDGIGLGWIILNPGGGQPGTPGEIVEKTGGGGGFTTYIALNPAQHTGIFFALTNGGRWQHINPFYAANNILLGLSGLPPLPEPSPRVLVRGTRRPAKHAPAKRSPRRPRRQ